jgi:hypothetical protein
MIFIFENFFSFLKQKNRLATPNLYIAHSNNYYLKDSLQSYNSTDLTIKANKTIVTLKNKSIFVNSQPVILPFSNSDIKIKRATDFYITFEGKNLSRKNLVNIDIIKLLNSI